MCMAEAVVAGATLGAVWPLLTFLLPPRAFAWLYRRTGGR